MEMRAMMIRDPIIAEILAVAPELTPEQRRIKDLLFDLFWYGYVVFESKETKCES